MTDSHIWYLKVSTFRGAIGAMHSYGVVEAPSRVVEHEGKHYKVKGANWGIQRIMTAEQAERLNTHNERFGRTYATNNVAGDPSQQFDSDEEVETYGLAVFRQFCTDPRDVLLVCSAFGESGPAKPLAGPAEVVAVLEEIWALDESETSNDWTDIREEASRQWDAALERFALTSDYHGSFTMSFGTRDPGAPTDGESTRALVSTNPDGSLRVIDEDSFYDEAEPVTDLVIPDETDGLDRVDDEDGEAR